MFGFRRRARDPGHAARVAALAAEIGGFGPEVTLKASEIVCPDPACPGTETVVLVMAPGRATRAVRIARPIAEVTAEDVASALRSSSA